MSRLRPIGTPALPARPEVAAEGGGRGELAAAVLESRVYREVTVPRTAIPAKMRLLSRTEAKAVRSASRSAVAQLGLVAAGPEVESLTEWREERALRTVAVAMRDPANPERPLAGLAEWEECDDDQILALWDIYQDLAAELDPLGDSAPPLTEGELAELVAAAKKGDAGLLMSFGSRRLALFAISSADRPSS